MTPDYKNKSQTAFGVAIICAGFLLETRQITGGAFNQGTRIVLGAILLVFIYSLIGGIVWHRRYKAQPPR